MTAAAYKRGSRIVSREADERMADAMRRADRHAHTDEVARLREQVASLERELHRARRCIAAERAGREAPVRPPPSLPSMRPDPERKARGGSKRATYEVGATYGRLRVVAVRPKGWAGANIYTAACLLCGKYHDYSGSLINLESRRNSPCLECRRGCAWRKGAA